MMGEAACDCEAVAIHVHARGAGGGGGGATGGWMAGSTAGLSAATGGMPSSQSSSSSLFSSTSSLTTDKEDGEDGATSSPQDRHASSMSSSSLASSESETFQVDAPAGGPLYELSTMMDHLPAVRTGLSKHYQGRSQSFTSLADVSCVEDLAKKTTPYIRRPKASRRYAAPLGVKNNRFSKTAVKKGPAGRKPPA